MTRPARTIGRLLTRLTTRLATVAAVAIVAGELRAQETLDTGSLDTGPTEGLFSLPRLQDDIAIWQLARTEIADRAYEPAVERLHRLLRSGSRGVVPVIAAHERWTGVRKAAIETLAELPPEGLVAYERLCRLEAGPIWERPIAELSVDELQYLAQAFPVASRGLEARLRLGDLALVAGDGIAAQQQFRSALDACPRQSERRASIIPRIDVADLLVRARTEQREPDSEAATAARAALPPTGSVGWVAYGGGHDGQRPMDAPIGAPKDAYRLPLRADGFELNDYAMHLVGDLSALYVNDGHSVRAIDPIRREVIWDWQGPMADSEEVSGTRQAINPDTVLACAFGEDVVVASLQVPNDVVGASQNHRFRDVINIITKIPVRRLFAWDRTTGTLLWSHWDFDNGPISRRFEGHDCCGVPIVQGDTVYVPTHDQTGAIAFYASAYDLKTGEPRWRRLICSSQQEVNMFGNAEHEFTAGPMAVDSGVLYGTTNLGVCYAVDTRDGEVRWITAYPSIPLPRARLRDQEPRPVFFANNPIVIHDGTLATTPLDSEFAIGIDTATGRPLWHMPYDGRGDTMIRWLLGAIGDEFVFSGLGIVAVGTRPDEHGRPAVRRIASPEALGEDHYRSAAIPRGAVTEDRIWYVGSDSGIRILDIRGNRDPRMEQMTISGRGNLLMVDGIAATAMNGQILVWADVPALVRDAEERAKSEEPDPHAVLRLATLLRARNSVDPEALDRLFESGLATAVERGLGPGSTVHRQLAAGLFELTMDRAATAKDPARQIALYELARSRATGPEDWIRVQEAILETTRGDATAHLRELRRMAARFPDAMSVFPEVGRAPIGVYTAWVGIRHIEDPKEAALACQQLIQRYGDVPLGELTAAERAEQTLRELVERHGQSVLESVEAAAAEELEAAGQDTELLRRVITRFPLTDASQHAADRLLDVALASGDLGAVARTYARISGNSTPRAGAMRRFVAAARAGGNQALAHALATRLRDFAGDRPSDFPPDGGVSYAAALADVAPPPPAEVLRPALPRAVIAELPAPSGQNSHAYVPVQVADGFPAEEPLPLFVSPAEGRLALHDLGAERVDPNAPVGVVSIRGALDGPLLLCGTVAVGVDSQRAFGIDIADGSLRWEIPAERTGGITALDVSSGVLHLFRVEGASRATGGSLLGVEPLSGTVLFDRAIPAPEAIAPPVPAAGLLWTLDASTPSAPVLRARDPVSGETVETTPIGAEALRFLGLEGRFARRLEDPTLRQRLFADADRIYLPIDIAMPEEPPRLVALSRGTGAVDWQWSGLPGCSLHLAGLHGSRIVVFEWSNARARLSLLAQDGKPSAETFQFGRIATVRNWDRPPHGGPVPDVLLITDASELATAPRLTAISVDPAGPRFEHPLDGISRILQNPFLGDGYLLLPLSRPGRADPMIDVLDLHTRGGALPGGEKALRLDVTHPMKVYRHGRHVIVETLDVLRVMGAPR